MWLNCPYLLTMNQVTEAQFSEIYKDHLEWLNSKYTRGKRALFFRADLSKLDLSRKNLTAAQFSRCSLRHVNFTSTQLETCSFQDCCFESTKFHHANLKKTVFIDCSDYASAFSSADLTDSCFVRFYTIAANFDNAKMNKCRMSDCSMMSSSLYEADLMASDLASVNFTGSSFIAANLTDAVLFSTTLSRCNFTHANHQKMHIQMGCHFDGTVGLPIYQMVFCDEPMTSTITVFMPTHDTNSWQFVTDFASGTQGQVEALIDQRFKPGSIPHARFKRALNSLMLLAKTNPHYNT